MSYLHTVTLGTCVVYSMQTDVYYFVKLTPLLFKLTIAFQCTLIYLSLTRVTHVQKAIVS